MQVVFKLVTEFHCPSHAIVADSDLTGLSAMEVIAVSIGRLQIFAQMPDIQSRNLQIPATCKEDGFG